MERFPYARGFWVCGVCPNNQYTYDSSGWARHKLSQTHQSSLCQRNMPTNRAIENSSLDDNHHDNLDVPNSTNELEGGVMQRESITEQSVNSILYHQNHHLWKAILLRGKEMFPTLFKSDVTADLQNFTDVSGKVYNRTLFLTSNHTATGHQDIHGTTSINVQEGEQYSAVLTIPKKTAQGLLRHGHPQRTAHKLPFESLTLIITKQNVTLCGSCGETPLSFMPISGASSSMRCLAHSFLGCPRNFFLFIFKGEALTFGDLHDKPLYTPGPKPFKRILSTHAQVSIKDAVALNWMSAVDAQRYDVYHNLSCVQFQAILDQDHGMMQQAYNKYLAANTKLMILLGSENSATKKHIQCTFIEKEHLGFLWFEIILYKQRLIELFGSYVQFLGQNIHLLRCFKNVLNSMMIQMLNMIISSNSGSGSWDDATSIQQVSGSKYKANDLTRQYKIVPYSGLRNSAYEKELNAGHTNRAAVLRPSPGMKIQHLHKGIREYVSRNPADFKDYLDEISAETKYLNTISRLVKKENGPDARNRIGRRILQAAENSGDITDEGELFLSLFINQPTWLLCCCLVRSLALELIE
ncbi:hypothetical protein PROFUN_14785 [Planoprotostelium fungivorum]|uniref:Uncharacterized protein n=1 Tax=Planoprotostelium fungivorum TaxID=1890364 RepID=A0A2P6MYJ2_9EUKA|nr:hypothetical protein PROFUN_14785 [Planoprotostelium fungivorum]